MRGVALVDPCFPKFLKGGAQVVAARFMQGSVTMAFSGAEQGTFTSCDCVRAYTHGALHWDSCTGTAKSCLLFIFVARTRDRPAICLAWRRHNSAPIPLLTSRPLVALAWSYPLACEQGFPLVVLFLSPSYRSRSTITTSLPSEK